MRTYHYLALRTIQDLRRIPCFCRITKEPTAELAKIHDRMPVMLPENLINDWINPSSNPDEIIRYSLSDMVIEKTDG